MVLSLTEEGPHPSHPRAHNHHFCPSRVSSPHCHPLQVFRADLSLGKSVLWTEYLYPPPSLQCPKLLGSQYHLVGMITGLGALPSSPTYPTGFSEQLGHAKHWAEDERPGVASGTLRTRVCSKLQG